MLSIIKKYFWPATIKERKRSSVGLVPPVLCPRPAQFYVVKK